MQQVVREKFDFPAIFFDKSAGPCVISADGEKTNANPHGSQPKELFGRAVFRLDVKNSHSQGNFQPMNILT
jgi:hypothetical protein